MGKKADRLARKAQQAAEDQLHAGDAEQEAENTAFEGSLEVGVSEEEREGDPVYVEASPDNPMLEESELTEPSAADPNALVKEQAAKARKIKAERATKELLEKYPHVKLISEMGPHGPKRVVIECTDPQTKQGPDGKAVSVCVKKREIAVQDLFQVTRCEPCQDRIVRKARRVRQAAKDKQLRKMAAALKQG